MESTTNSSLSIRLKPISIFLLLFTSLLWGSTFIIAKNFTINVPVFFYLWIRYLIAGFSFIPLVLYRFKSFNKYTIKAGIINGFVYFLAITTQTMGLQTTTAGKAGFITGLNILIVPFLAWIIFKKAIKKRIWIAVFIAFIGIAFLMLEGPAGIVIGDVFELFCAFFCAVYIILIEVHLNNKQGIAVDVYLYCFIQILIVSLVSFIFATFFLESITSITFDMNFWLIIIYLGTIVTTLTFIFQNWAQQNVDSSKTAIVLAIEPVFALIFASFLIGDEIITFQGIIGSTLIFFAILIAFVKDNHGKKILKPFEIMDCKEKESKKKRRRD